MQAVNFAAVALIVTLFLLSQCEQ